IVCASTLVNPNDGCEPLNLFGHGRMTQAARDYVLDTTRGATLTRQRFAEISASREVLPNRSAGPLSIAVGASYREELLDARMLPPEATERMPRLDEVSYRGLPPAQSGAPFIFQHANMLEAAGGYDVKEIFAESLIPLVARSTQRGLDLNVAGRWADYEGSGSIAAWKAGIDWRVNEAFRFRATRSRDIRAANLGERFDRTITGQSYDDPWIGEEHTPVEQTVSGGNPAVDPERSDTTTFGIVVQPAAIDDLSLSIDWYDVRIKDAIDQIGGQLIIDLCYEEGSFCELLQRDAVTGRITRVDNIFVNLVEAGVKGVDLELSYRRPIGDGTLGLRFFGAYLSEHSFTDQFGNKVDSAGMTGDASLPEWQGVLNVSYDRGPFSLTLTERYIGSGTRDNREIEGIDIDDNTVDAAWYTNVRFSYDVMPAGTVRVFLNVQNLLDEDPPLAPGPFSFFGGAGHTNAQLFDMLGRRYTIGFVYRL
ncbi:MAG TPA: TonB-dependent receptor, partial [Gammaproteobacteria bacterium]